MPLKRLCSAADVAPGSGLRADLEGASYAVFNLDGRYFVTAEMCTHGPGALSEGFVLDDEIECPFHQGRFHIPSGRPTEPPCTVPIRVWTAHVENGEVLIDPDERATGAPDERATGAPDDRAPGAPDERARGA